MGNHCCAPGSKNEYDQVTGPPIDHQLINGELHIKRNRKILEANMGQKIAEISATEGDAYVPLRERRKTLPK